MIITCMGPILYDAAAKGNIMAFKDDSFKRPLEALLTPNKNTVLHIFITTLKNGIESTENNFVGDILNMCPSLLCQVNVKDETPLHVAARYGHTNIVEVLIEHAKHPHHQDLGSRADAVRKMLRMVNKEKDTALHEAVRYNHLQVVKLLINDDPGFSYSVNDAGETPLYIAVERNYKNLVLEILNTCNSPAYDGPDGRTALHAAVFWDNKVTIKAILERIGGPITEKADKQGWTPLHLAAYSGGWWSTQLLLEHDSQVANMKEEEGRTALHIAAQRCNVRIIKMIIAMCPDCCLLVDNKDCNVFHFAELSRLPVLTVGVIRENSSALSNLLDEKDAEGNTPPLYSRCIEYANEYLKMDHPRVDKMPSKK
ncbi:hypothetical protein F2P56_020076 [Juglans regia]|uniref:Ankyrin-1-like n=1 Tax=Juglans regia TaxID=51240 RepID=A0A833U3K3_JUGRE|nr:hypothetical protein F2P56_020076 [Juglans regia]